MWEELKYKTKKKRAKNERIHKGLKGLNRARLLYILNGHKIQYLSIRIEEKKNVLAAIA